MELVITIYYESDGFFKFRRNINMIFPKRQDADFETPISCTNMNNHDTEQYNITI